MVWHKIMLGQIPDQVFLKIRMGHITLIHTHRLAFPSLRSKYHPQQTGFSRSVSSKQSGYFSGFNFKIDTLQYLSAIVFKPHTIGFQRLHHDNSVIWPIKANRDIGRKNKVKSSMKAERNNLVSDIPLFE
jgi:hypothetical protein